jgi:hypothetical protein
MCFLPLGRLRFECQPILSIDEDADVRMWISGITPVGAKPVIITSGKQATYDILDAETGKWIYSKDLGCKTSFPPSIPSPARRPSIRKRC